MKSINILILIVMSLMLTHNSVSASSSKSVKKGIEAYEQGKYEDAMKSFIDAQLQRPELPELYYNIGSAAYKKEDYEAAFNNFTKAKESLKDSKDDDTKLLREKSIYNLGNTKYRMGDLEGAVKEFQQIPKTSQIYNDAKENIEFVKKKIEEQKKQNQQDNKNQNQDSQDKKENKDKEEKDNKKEQSKENQDKDKKEQNKQNQGDKEQEQQNKAEQDKKNQEQQQNEHQQNQEQQQNQDKKQQEQNGEQQQPKDSKQVEKQTGESKEKNSEKGENQQSREHLLNRLEDKPGSAMMPVYSEQPVLKDW
ncbi:MAG: tetratricopeptide repeat protein [Desulfamplus sp.]|nr:tetratricopeptide repeat protein [Desulfamplus sp.]